VHIAVLAVFSYFFSRFGLFYAVLQGTCHGLPAGWQDDGTVGMLLQDGMRGGRSETGQEGRAGGGERKQTYGLVECLLTGKP
jgi:hypothetical protein